MNDNQQLKQRKHNDKQCETREQLDKKNTNTQSLNVQLRKDLDLAVNVVHGFSIPGLKTRRARGAASAGRCCWRRRLASCKRLPVALERPLRAAARPSLPP